MTDNTTADPATLAEARKRYREIAPVPDPSSADPGAALGAYLTAVGLRRMSLARDSYDDAEGARVAMCAALLWHLISNSDPDYARPAAQRIASAWADGDGVGEWLHDLAGGYDVDPAQVNGIAQLEALLLSARQADAERAAKARLSATDALVRDVLESLCRRDGLPLESSVTPGEPARNYELADRLGIGRVFGLKPEVPQQREPNRM